MNEKLACQKFCQIISAVEYCHLKNIIHRDLKVNKKHCTLKLGGLDIIKAHSLYGDVSLSFFSSANQFLKNRRNC